MNKKLIKNNSAKLRIYIDIFFFTLMVLVLIPQSTGILIHEWASIIILLPFILHLLINWNWIKVNSTKFIKRQPQKKRFDYVFDWILYWTMITVTLSGIVISESALPLLGLHFDPDAFWNQIHNTSAVILMVLLGVHIALHWKWIKASYNKFKLIKDLYNITEVKTLISKDIYPLFFLIFFSIISSIIIWLFDYSLWAENIRIETGPIEKSDGFPQSWKIYALPLIKVIILISIPGILTNWVIQLKEKH